MAIRGFLSGQNGGAIMQAIDLDFVTSGPTIEKYLVLLMEEGLVVLSIKYDLGGTELPAISLVKQAPKLLADCICPNTFPLEKKDLPSFWIAKDNWIQLVQIDASKPQKLIQLKDQKFEYEQRQAKATALRQSFLKQTNYVNGEDIEQIDSFIAVATSDSAEQNDVGGGTDVVIVHLQSKQITSMT